MIDRLYINPNRDTPKYKQIVYAIEKGVTEKVFLKSDKLPSINDLCANFNLSRDTVVKAYNILREKGIIEATHGKGYFISSTVLVPQMKVFVLFNELNGYKEVLHKALISTLGASVEIDTFFHNHNLEVFEYLIERALKKYTHYVIMPTFNSNHKKVIEVVKKIPTKKLFLIDRSLPNFEVGCVFQDFRKDAYHGFMKLRSKIKKYEKITIIYKPEYMHPFVTVLGIKEFCEEQGIEVEETHKITEINTGVLYVTLNDDELVTLVKQGNTQGFVPGIEYGIISYNDSPLKELIYEGITVISTDFEDMGHKVGKMILENSQEYVPNKLKVIDRHSI